MKKQFYLLPLLLLLVSVFTSPAFAHNHKGDDPTPPPTTSTALPINSAVLLLAIAGLVIGIAALYKFKLKAVKA